MHKQLELLIMLHDLDLLLDEAKRERKAGFEVDKHKEELHTAKERVKEKLDSNILNQYNKLSEKYPRAVVPVIDGVCYGCFMKLPSAFVIRKNKNESINFCPNCGRFIYWFED
jgi:predicted  nucleic acid-binding Zn-ribbon protein